MDEDQLKAVKIRVEKRRTKAAARRSSNLNTSTGLYQLATQRGFQPEADRLLAAHEGEDNKEIFSGGFITDIFDTLNALQYGVVGLMKGTTFGEGVRTRQSFSDKDSLGANGLPGVVGGVILDIIFDPLTYIPPLAILKRIPLAVKGGKAAQKALFGERVVKSVPIPGESRSLLQTAQEGGTRIGNFLATRFVYKFGADPIYTKIEEKMIKNIGVATTETAKLMQKVSKFDDELASKLVTSTFDAELGRTIIERTPIEDLAKILSPEEFATVQASYAKIDDLGREAVELGLLSEAKFEETVGRYLTNAYREFELSDAKKIFPSKKVGVSTQKARVAGLTEEAIEELGRIENPAYLLFNTTIKLVRDVENAKLTKQINELFATSVPIEGFTQLVGKSLNVTDGAKAGIKKTIGELNDGIKPVITDLKRTFKADKAVLRELNTIESTIAKLGAKRSDELFEFFTQESKISKVVAARRTIQGAAKLPDVLQILGRAVEKSLQKTGGDASKISKELSIKLEKAFEEGALQTNGFKTIKEFTDFLSTPFTKKPAKVVEKEVRKDDKLIERVIGFQKRIDKLSATSKTLKEIDKRSIDNSFINLEHRLSDLRFAKEDEIAKLNELKLLDLNGKYVPDEIHRMLTELSEPYAQTFGTKLIGAFKYNKVILNPATHARNIMSNIVLNWWKLGIGPWRLDLYAEAARQATKGGKWVDELIESKVGYNINTFASQELRGILEGPEVSRFGKGIGSKWQKMKNSIADMYQWEENTAKLAAYISHRKKGIDIEEAWKAAESATFNYAQVTPFIRKMRQSIWGLPFITFTLKATPVAIETALKHPVRVSIFGKIKTAIENQSDIKETARERASEPPWVKDGFFIKLPMKDKFGRSSYFDLTYIIPFGDLVSGGFFERQIVRDTGIAESIPMALVGKVPMLNFIKEISRNQDFFGRKLWKESDPIAMQTVDLMRHLTKTFAPPLVAQEIPGGYNTSGERVDTGVSRTKTASEENQQRTAVQEFFRNIGLKVSPIDVQIQESMKEWNQEKALSQLMREKGVLKEFSTNYIPKEPQSLR